MSQETREPGEVVGVTEKESHEDVILPVPAEFSVLHKNIHVTTVLTIGLAGCHCCVLYTHGKQRLRKLVKVNRM